MAPVPIHAALAESFRLHQVGRAAVGKPEGLSAVRNSSLRSQSAHDFRKQAGVKPRRDFDDGSTNTNQECRSDVIGHIPRKGDPIGIERQ